MNLQFYLARLKHASLPELIYRVTQYVFEIYLRRGWGSQDYSGGSVSVGKSEINSLVMPSCKYHVPAQVINELLAGSVFSLHEEESIIKEFEAQSGKEFYADIALSNASPDIRAIWEPARLQHITALLLYLRQGDRAKHKKAINEFIKGSIIQWIRNNPFPYGPHYMSAMECGLRVPVFLYCIKLLDNLTNEESELIRDAMYQHAWLISKRLSLYSSLGNHTIVECVGLVFAGAVFYKADAGRAWLSRGVELLRQELDHQILLDGGPVEQSMNYHRFVLDMYWLTVDFLEKNNLYDCKDITPKLMRGESFIAAFQDSYGNLPSIGDSDDGYAIAPGILPVRLQTEHIKEDVAVFKDAGYTVITTENDVKLTFDHGPLGMPPLYNHGHADALSVTLSKEGRMMLVDPGTYRYNGVPEGRRYFKGTRAHNTVTIDGLDQAVQETGFIWSRPYAVDLACAERADTGYYTSATHNGYSRLDEPVWHTRSLQYFDHANFLIKDTFSGTGVHDYELNYQLHPDISAHKQDGWWVLENSGAVIYLKLLGENDFNFVNGQKNPLHGWYSPAYGVKEASGVLTCRVHGHVNDVSFATVICTDIQIEPM